MFDRIKDNFPLLKDKWDEYESYYTRIEVPAKTIRFSPIRYGQGNARGHF